jgi:hypothetical protein
MAIYAMRTIQLGVETTWGTAVTPNRALRGLQDLKVNVDPQVTVESELGVYVPNIVKRKTPLVDGSLELGVSYQHIIYPFAMLFGASTPSGSDPYTWTFNAPTTSPSSPKSFTGKYGFSGGVYQITGMLANNLTLSGQADEDLTCSLDFLGRTVSPVTSLETIALPEVDYVSISNGKFYLDNWTGTPGTTEILGTLISFELTINPNRHTKQFISSAAQPEAFGEGAWEIGLNCVFEWNATSKAIVDASLSDSVQKQIKISFTKSASRSLSFIIPVILTDQYTLFSDRDGNATVELSFKALYDATNSRILTVQVVNDVSAL